MSLIVWTKVHAPIDNQLYWRQKCQTDCHVVALLAMPVVLFLFFLCVTLRILCEPLRSLTVFNETTIRNDSGIVFVRNILVRDLIHTFLGFRCYNLLLVFKLVKKMIKKGGNLCLKKAVIIAMAFVSSQVSSTEIQAFKQTAQTVKQSLSNPNNLILATGSFNPKQQELDFSSKGIAAISSQNYGIVQFNAKKSDYNWLQKNGFQVLQSMPKNAFVVQWNHANKDRLSTNKNIRWFGAYQAGYKISPQLWQENRKNPKHFQLLIHAFKDVSVKQLNGLIKKYFPNQKIVKTNIPSDFAQVVLEVKNSSLDNVLNKLAAIEDIQWITNYHAQQFFNAEATAAVQSGMTSGGSNDSYVPINTPLFDHGIFGSGQIVGIADSGLDRNEDWFVHLDKGNGIVTAITNAEDVTPPLVGTTHTNNKVFAYWTMPGAVAYDHGSTSYHGTHTSGSIAGDRQTTISGGVTGSISNPNSVGYDNDDGMAPNAQLLFNDIGSSSGLTGSGSKPMWQQAYAAGAFVHSNSYGAPTNGEYIGSDNQADEALRELDDLIILFAAGNDGAQTNSIASPGNAKNVTTVGALLHGNSSSVAYYSNKGPTDDGRLKPDISATGTSVESARGDSNNSNSVENASAISNSGTSMATPITAGATTLLRQYFTDGFYPTGTKTSANSIKPSGTLMKAMLLNGTKTDGGFFTNQIGWGRVWLDNNLYFPGDARKFRFWELKNNNGLKTGGQFSVDVDVLTGEEFRATLVWYDLPGPMGSGVTLVNNLDLTVQVGANSYKGNNFSSNNSVTSGTADAINTVEQVRFSNPVAGTYTLTVDASNIPGDGSYNSDKQGFALVVSGALGSGNTPNPNPVSPNPLTATANGVNGINLSWTDASADYDYYEVYRTQGTCASADLTAMRLVGQSATNSYTDDSTTGGYQYAYKIRALSADLVSEYSNCVDVISSQACDIPPTFAASSAVVSNNTASSCTISLQWQAASSNCPLNNAVHYNIYRSTIHGFTANASNKLGTTSALSFNDINAVMPNQTYFYMVKAEDSANNESLLSNEIAASAFGIGTAEGQLIDDVDNVSVMTLDGVWNISNERSSNGILSYRSAAEGANTYQANTCGRMYSKTISIPANPSSPASMSYQARYNIEANWDGVVVEISTDGGSSWNDLPPTGGYPNDFSSTGNPPVNACGYASSHGAFNGTSNGNFQAVTHDLSAYHGQTIQVRWSFSTDPGSEDEGFYLDELQFNNVNAPLACTMNTDLIFKHGFEL